MVSGQDVESGHEIDSGYVSGHGVVSGHRVVSGHIVAISFAVWNASYDNQSALCDKTYVLHIIPELFSSNFPLTKVFSQSIN